MYRLPSVKQSVVCWQQRGKRAARKSSRSPATAHATSTVALSCSAMSTFQIPCRTVNTARRGYCDSANYMPLDGSQPCRRARRGGSTPTGGNKPNERRFKARRTGYKTLLPLQVFVFHGNTQTRARYCSMPRIYAAGEWSTRTANPGTAVQIRRAAVMSKG